MNLNRRFLWIGMAVLLTVFVQETAQSSLIAKSRSRMLDVVEVADSELASQDHSHDTGKSSRNAFRVRYDDSERKHERSDFRVKDIPTELASVSNPSTSSNAIPQPQSFQNVVSRHASELTEVASPSALISFRYPQQATQNNKQMPGRMMLELHSPEDEMDYKSIYGYIRHYYKRVPDEEASLIAKSLVSYGRKHDLDPKFAAAVMARESAFNRHAISSSGARGLGQIKSLNYPALNIEDPHNIEQNTQGTVKYLKTMLTLWKGKSDSVALALASYYKGQGAVKRTQGQLDARTIGYVTDIMKNYDKLKLIKEDQKL